MKIRTHWYRGLYAAHVSMTGGLLFMALLVLVWSYVLAPIGVRYVRAGGYGAFSPTSFWNSRIPRYPSENQGSDIIVGSVASQASSSGVVFDTANAAAPIYAAEVSTPTVVVLPSGCNGAAGHAALATAWQAVPIPFYAQPSAGPDRRMVVYQSSTATIWEFDQMHQSNGQWYACNGGKITGVNVSNGSFSGTSGALRSGLAMMGGQITVSDINRGFIGHTMGLGLPSVGGGAVWPASASVSTGGSVPVGTRLQLDPSLDVGSLGLSPFAQLVAKTAQTYGFVVWGSASKVTVYGEGENSFLTRGASSPYASMSSVSLAGFPWDKLRALPSGYGQYGQAPTIDSFTVTPQIIPAGEIPSFGWSAYNVDECAIPGVKGNLSATGSLTGENLLADTSYTLSCSGPWGSVSRQSDVAVVGLGTNSEPPTVTVTTISVAQRDKITPLDSLLQEWAKTEIQKVVYYERDTFLMSTTRSPFEFDTRLLPDGPRVLGVRVFHRDGHEERHTVTLRVQNQPEQLIISGPLSQSTPPEYRSLALAGVVGGVLMVMIFGGVYGWRVSHPRQPKQPLSWLVSYR